MKSVFDWIQLPKSKRDEIILGATLYRAPTRLLKTKNKYFVFVNMHTRIFLYIMNFLLYSKLFLLGHKRCCQRVKNFRPGPARPVSARFGSLKVICKNKFVLLSTTKNFNQSTSLKEGRCITKKISIRFPAKQKIFEF